MLTISYGFANVYTLIFQKEYVNKLQIPLFSLSTPIGLKISPKPHSNKKGNSGYHSNSDHSLTINNNPSSHNNNTFLSTSSEISSSTYTSQVTHSHTHKNHNHLFLRHPPIPKPNVVPGAQGWPKFVILTLLHIFTKCLSQLMGKQVSNTSSASNIFSNNFF